MPPEADDRTAGLPEGSAAESGLPAANPSAHSRLSGEFTVVVVLGEIDMATAGALAEHLDAATARPEPQVLVDLRSADFFDCSGLRLLCRADSRAKERGGALRVVSNQPRIHRLLRASGLLKRFPPLPDLPPPSAPDSAIEPRPQE
ncbi:STAS domain-containing protein [Streptomyces montanus]|uniref:Anti-sigma factor antagonist n=1 Tax=Streptomyces montanus TaxID=2580423 RepID=A0A5R9FMI9_9ACTN|nr:STAS domain-containing protein [Streptomyces montanus]TLS41754.1 STAS domain-containing protein [Streptomyces montanus]